MSLNPISWPLAVKLAALAVLAAAAGGGIAFMMRPEHVTLRNQAATARAGVAASPQQTSSAGPTPAAEPGISTYLCPFSNAYMLLQWSTAGGSITGTYQDVRLTGDAPSEEASSSSGRFGGTVNGSGITLTFVAFDLFDASTWYGTFSVIQNPM